MQAAISGGGPAVVGTSSIGKATGLKRCYDSGTVAKCPWLYFSIMLAVRIGIVVGTQLQGLPVIVRGCAKNDGFLRKCERNNMHPYQHEQQNGRHEDNSSDNQSAITAYV